MVGLGAADAGEHRDAECEGLAGSRWERARRDRARRGRRAGGLNGNGSVIPDASSASTSSAGTPRRQTRKTLWKLQSRGPRKRPATDVLRPLVRTTCRGYRRFGPDPPGSRVERTCVRLSCCHGCINDRCHTIGRHHGPVHRGARGGGGRSRRSVSPPPEVARADRRARPSVGLGNLGVPIDGALALMARRDRHWCGP